MEKLFKSRSEKGLRIIERFEEGENDALEALGKLYELFSDELGGYQRFIQQTIDNEISEFIDGTQNKISSVVLKREGFSDFNKAAYVVDTESIDDMKGLYAEVLKEVEGIVKKYKSYLELHFRFTEIFNPSDGENVHMGIYRIERMLNEESHHSLEDIRVTMNQVDKVSDNELEEILIEAYSKSVKGLHYGVSVQSTYSSNSSKGKNFLIVTYSFEDMLVLQEKFVPIVRNIASELAEVITIQFVLIETLDESSD